MKEAQWQLGHLAMTSLLVLTAAVRSELSVADPCIISSDGSQGVCKPISDCPWVVSQLRNRTRPTVCGYVERVLITCCKLDSEPSESTSDIPLKRISELKCDEYKRKYEEDLDEPVVLSNTSIKVIRDCPLLASPTRVEDEHATAEGDAPFMVAVGFTSGNLSDIKWSCGGALISGTFVVTAAHCSFSHETGSVPTVVRVGVRHLGGTPVPDKPLDSFFVAKVIVHPNYTGSGSYYDITLLQLETEVRFTKNLRPACLWRNDDISKSSAVALGWGLNGPKKSDYLEKTSLNLMETRTCQTKVMSSSKIPNGITSELLCAGDTRRHRNQPCKVDVGGPLVVSSPEDECMFYLIGVMSFVPNCDLGSPVVFTRISSYLPWIESVVWPDN